jgi:hypothetical protein
MTVPWTVGDGAAMMEGYTRLGQIARSGSPENWDGEQCRSLQGITLVEAWRTGPDVSG